jgi:hypothetical protein
MDFGLLFTRSWTILWRHKFLWALGLLSGVGQIAGLLFRLWFSGYLQQDLLPIFTAVPPEEWLFSDNLQIIDPLAAEFFRGELLIVGTFWLFLVLIVFWLLFTLSEAALIAATLAIEAKRPTSLKQSLSLGYKFLRRFIAIDALVFLPWFLLALAAMVLAVVVMAAAVGLSVQGASTQSLMGTMLTGFACVSLLVCLLLPLSFLTIRFRTMAFRDTAVFGGHVRESVAHTWQVVRANLGNVILLIAVLWGVNYVFGLITSLITVPLNGVTAVSAFTSGSLSWNGGVVKLLSILVTLLLAIPQAMLLAFTGIAWTLAYLDMANGTKDETAL